MGPVAISVPTLVLEVVIFVGMVYAMERLVFGPLRAKWAERDRLVEEGLAASNEGREEQLQAREEVLRLLRGARQTAQGEIDAATAEGNRARDELVARATAEFRRLVDEARERIVAERQRSAEQLQTRIVDFAIEAAAAVTGQSFAEPQVRELAAAVVSREGLA
jgi:F-type H+-transporting ATPase subunit b